MNAVCPVDRSHVLLKTKQKKLNHHQLLLDFTSRFCLCQLREPAFLKGALRGQSQRTFNLPQVEMELHHSLKQNRLVSCEGVNVVPAPPTAPETDGAVLAGTQQVPLLVEAEASDGRLVMQQSPHIHMSPHVVQPEGGVIVVGTTPLQDSP